MDISEDEWLTAVFEHAVFRVQVVREAPHPEDLDLLDADLRRRRAGGRPAMYYAKVPTSDVATLRELARRGFYVVDVSVTLACEPSRLVSPTSDPAVSVEPVEPGQADAVLRIAESAFRYSRFHLDPQVPRRIADRVKREWVASYLNGRRGDALYAATREDGVAGFLAVLTRSTDTGPVAVIDLIGVDRARQGCGVGQALVRAFQSRYGGTHAGLKVGTQAANIPSLRLYERCGFTVEDTAYVLHCHAGSA